MCSEFETNLRARRGYAAATTFGAGEDGLPTDLYAEVEKLGGETWDILVSHLRRLYREIYENGRMPDNMREFITSLIHKGKGRIRGRNGFGSPKREISL